MIRITRIWFSIKSRLASLKRAFHAGAHKGFHQAHTGNIFLHHGIGRLFRMNPRKSGSILRRKTINAEVAPSAEHVSASWRLVLNMRMRLPDHQQAARRAKICTMRCTAAVESAIINHRL